MKRIEWTVEAGAGPQRADKAVARQLTELAGWRIRALFDRRDVRRNGERIRPEDAVHPGDTLTAFLPETAPALDIVHEDDAYLIINKRQGMPVQGEGSVEAVHARQAGQAVYACHRLDVNTGGLLLLAKTPQSLDEAVQAFAAHRIIKRYEAIVRGTPNPPAAVLRGYLQKDARAARVCIVQSPAHHFTLPVSTYC